jgi:pilus assembly protein CpaB
MRNVRPIVIILLSLIIGSLAVYLAMHWIGQRTEVSTIKVVVASRDLELGSVLQEEMMEVIDWPAVSTIKEPIADPKLIYQRVTNTAVLRGEPILVSKLAADGEKGGLSALLQDGSRAVTVKVNEIVGVAGFALPGNYVDVMVHVTDKQDQSISKIVLERILVLALAQNASTNELKPRVVNAVTLKVTPEQAEQIDFARNTGSLSLVLRSQVDKGHVRTNGVRMNDLFKPSDHQLSKVENISTLEDLNTAKVKNTQNKLNIKITRAIGTPTKTSSILPPVAKYELIRGIIKTSE